MICASLECDRDAVCRGLCRRCYQQRRWEAIRRGEWNPWGREPVEPKICAQTGCERHAAVKGLCRKHYKKDWENKLKADRESL